MANFVKCRCPKCGHIRGEAEEGSTVRLHCRSDKLKFFGVVRNGKFLCVGQTELNPPSNIAKPPPFMTG
jgi:hypothetical protein